MSYRKQVHTKKDNLVFSSFVFITISSNLMGVNTKCSCCVLIKILHFKNSTYHHQSTRFICRLHAMCNHNQHTITKSATLPPAYITINSINQASCLRPIAIVYFFASANNINQPLVKNTHHGIQYQKILNHQPPH